MDESTKSLISAAAAAMGRIGGRVLAESMTPEQRSERARNAALKRWRPKRKRVKKKTA